MTYLDFWKWMFSLFKEWILILFGLLFIMIGIGASQKRKPHWHVAIIVGFLLVVLGVDQGLGWPLVEALLKFFKLFPV